MSPKRFCVPALAAACLAGLSSCNLFKKEETAAQDSTYDAATAYSAGTGQTTGQSANAYGAAGASDAANAYTQPGYTPPATPAPYTPPAYTQPPYTQPSAGYDAGAGSGTGSAAGAYAGGSGRTHKVARGDTLTGISRRYSVGISELMRANNLNSDLIREGQNLIIP